MRKFALLGLALVLSACATTTPSAAPITLDGTAWTVTAISGTPTITTNPPTMTFASGQVSGGTGCNHYGGGFTQNGSSVTFTQVAITAMACLDDAVMKQENSFTTALGKVARLGGTADAPILQDSSGQALFSLAKAAPAASPSPLEGTTWSLQTIRTSGAASSVVSGSEVTMKVSGGTVSGKACNTFRGTVTVDGSNITVGPLATTRMACPSEELTQQENTVLKLLGAAKTMTIDGATLSLSTADGDGLDFTAK